MDNRPHVPHVEIVIAYDHKYRKVYATSVFKSQSGNWCVTAWDPDVNDGDGGFRTFREDRIKGGIHFVRNALPNT